MKLCLILIINLISCSLSIQDSPSQIQKWRMFKEQHGKMYPNTSVEAARYFSSQIEQVFLNLEFEIFFSLT
jgi:hypothetical protein